MQAEQCRVLSIRGVAMMALNLLCEGALKAIAKLGWVSHVSGPVPDSNSEPLALDVLLSYDAMQIIFSNPATVEALCRQFCHEKNPKLKTEENIFVQIPRSESRKETDDLHDGSLTRCTTRCTTAGVSVIARNSTRSGKNQIFSPLIILKELVLLNILCCSVLNILNVNFLIKSRF